MSTKKTTPKGTANFLHEHKKASDFKQKFGEDSAAEILQKKLSENGVSATREECKKHLELTDASYNSDISFDSCYHQFTTSSGINVLVTHEPDIQNKISEENGVRVSMEVTRSMDL